MPDFFFFFVQINKRKVFVSCFLVVSHCEICCGLLFLVIVTIPWIFEFMSDNCIGLYISECDFFI